MAYLGRGLDKISNIEVLDNITFDGSSSYSITKGSVAFTPNSAQSLLISIDGVVQATNFSVNSSTIDFGVAVPSTSVCNFFLHYGTGVMTVPSDGSVTTAKLGDDAVTGAKLSKPFNYDSGTFYLDDTNNRVGIGTTSPNAELEIKADTPEIRIDSTGASARNYKIHSDGDELYLEGIGSSGSLKIGESGTYNISIDLGTGASFVGSSSTTIPANATSGTYASIGDTYPLQSTNNNICAIFNRHSSTGTIVEFKYNGSFKGSISTNGSTISYNTSSDHRLKENITDITNATERLKQLQPKRFNFIADADTTVDGFLAHEVSDIVPEAVTGTKDAVDEDGNPEYQGIDQAKLVPLLVKTIQELEARITALESE